MSSILRRIHMDVALLGPHLFVPFFVIIVFDIFLLMVPKMATVVAIEFILPILSAWWCIFIVQPSLDKNARNVLYTYKTRLIMHGLCSVVRSFLYYALLIAFQCVFLSKAFALGSVSLWCQIMIQSSFYVGISFLALSLTHSEIAAIVVCVLYELASWTLVETFPNWLNIYTHDDVPLHGESLLMLVRTVLPLSVLLCVVAQSFYTDFYLLFEGGSTDTPS